MVPPVRAKSSVPMAFLVFSPAGKPVLFSRDSIKEEETLYAGLAAAAQALVSFADSKFRGPLRVFRKSTGRQLHFLDCPPLSFLAITEASVPGAITRARLALLHAQIAGLFTQPALCAIYERQPAYDLRRLLVGSGERMLRELIAGFGTRPCSFLGAVAVRAMGSDRRRGITDRLRLAVSESGSAFGVLFDSDGRLVSSIASSTAGAALCAWDSILLGNLCKVLEQAETVLSVCLPFYDSRGNFYAYVMQLGGYTIILLSGAEILDVEVFREAAMAVLCLCPEGGGGLDLDGLDDPVDGGGEDVLVIDGHPGIHFIFKNSRTNQYVMNGPCPPCAGGLGEVFGRYAGMRVAMFATDGIDVMMAEQILGSLDASHASKRSRPRRPIRPSHGFRLECVGATTYVAFANVDAEFYVSMDASTVARRRGQVSCTSVCDDHASAAEFAAALRARLVSQSQRLFFYVDQQSK